MKRSSTCVWVCVIVVSDAHGTRRTSRVTLTLDTRVISVRRHLKHQTHVSRCYLQCLFGFDRAVSSSGALEETHLVWSVVSVRTGLAVHSGRVLRAVHTHSSSHKLTVCVHAQTQIRHRLVVVTVAGLVVTVTF